MVQNLLRVQLSSTFRPGRRLHLCPLLPVLILGYVAYRLIGLVRQLPIFSESALQSFLICSLRARPRRINTQVIRNVRRKAHKVRTKFRSADTEHDGVRIDIPVDDGGVFGVEDANCLQERSVEGLAG